MSLLDRKQNIDDLFTFSHNYILVAFPRCDELFVGWKNAKVS